MVITELPNFTRRLFELMTDEEYRLLQAELIVRPDRGVVIPHSGGLRKMRWHGGGGGKRGGLRVVYYWNSSREQILLLIIYAKNERDDLTRDQARRLRRIVEEVFG